MRIRFPTLRRILKYCFYTLLCLLVLLYAVGFYNKYKRYSVCIQLPNGLRIGYEALFAPRRYWGNPIRVLKLPDSTILIPEAVNVVYFSKTTVYGNAGPIYGTKTHYEFAYRPDVGLVIKSKNPETYERLVGEAGQLIWFDDRRRHQSLMSVYRETKRNPAYRRLKCKLSILP